MVYIYGIYNKIVRNMKKGVSVVSLIFRIFRHFF